MATVVFDSVTITYPGATRPSVDRLNLAIDDGEFLVLVGPSGCGKSTSLRALAGLEPVTSGQVSIGGKDVTGLEPAARDIAMVFQNYALYPHMNVRKNIGYPLRLAKMPKAEIAAKVEETARVLGLSELLDRKPKDLSGGQGPGTGAKSPGVFVGRTIVKLGCKIAGAYAHGGGGIAATVGGDDGVCDARSGGSHDVGGSSGSVKGWGVTAGCCAPGAL